MLRKLGPSPLMIKDGGNKVSYENVSIFRGMVAWMVKQYTGMSYERCNNAHEVEKEELCSRVWVRNILIMKSKIIVFNYIRNFC